MTWLDLFNIIKKLCDFPDDRYENDNYRIIIASYHGQKIIKCYSKQKPIDSSEIIIISNGKLSLWSDNGKYNINIEDYEQYTDNSEITLVHGRVPEYNTLINSLKEIGI